MQKIDNIMPLSVDSITLLNRITIIGNGASGKTTLSRILSNITGLPVVHLDKYYWIDWKPITSSNWKIIHNELINQERWIIEGTQPGELKNRLERSNLIIFLDIPICVCFYRFIKKYIVNRITKRHHEYDDGFCYEIFDVKSLFWILNFRKNLRSKIIRMLESVKTPTIIIKNSQELDACFQGIKAISKSISSVDNKKD